MDWQGLAAILGLPIAALATTWAIVRDRSRIRLLERLTVSRATMTEGSRAQLITDRFIEDLVSELYFRYASPGNKVTSWLVFVVSYAGVIGCVFALLNYRNSEGDKIQALILFWTIYAVALSAAIAGMTLTIRNRRVSRTPAVTRFVDNATGYDKGSGNTQSKKSRIKSDR